MNETTKVVLVVSLAVVVSAIGGFLYGVLGAILGFLSVILIVALFALWRRYE